MTKDIEQGENAPLLGRTGAPPAAESRELKDMETESVKEKAVTGVAGLGCE